jgi:putative ABC transport system permease protein
MRSVLIVALNNLRRRKGQGVLVGAILALSVLLFFVAVGLLREVDGPFAAMFDAQSGSHFTLIFDTRIHDVDDVTTWWRSQSDVARVSDPLPTVLLSDRAYVGGREMTRLFYLTERSLTEQGVDELHVLDGTADAYPGPGQIWVSSTLAQDAAITAGQTMEIPAVGGLRPVEVSAVVVDPQFSAPFNSPSRVWIGPGQLAYYFPTTQLNSVLVGIRLRDPAGADSLWNAFVDHLGGVFNGGSYDYAAVRDGYTAPYSLMAVMLAAFSILSLLVALFAIHGTITSAILADFKVIGILRAQGFRPADVRLIYQYQYLLLALVAVPLGVAAGVLVVQQSITLVMSTLGRTIGVGALLPPAAVTVAIFLILVYLFVGRVARRAEAVRPVDAIRYGAAARSGRAAGVAIQRLRVLTVPLIVAVKTLALQRWRAAFLSGSVLFATMAASLAVNLDHSFERMREDLAIFGFDGADVRLNRAGRRFGMRHEAFMEAMRNHAGVAAIATSDVITGVVREPGSDRAQSISGWLVDGDMDGLRYLNMRGRNPETPFEVSIGANTARSLGKDVGDTLGIYLAGRRLDFAITGVFQTMNNGGQGFRIRLAALRLVDPFAAPSTYGVVLEPGVDPEQFIASVESEYGEAVDGQPGDYFIRDMLDSATSGMRVGNAFLAGVFLIAAAVFIFNATLMSIGENRRMFGILKTVGMTPSQLRASVVYSIGIQAAAGILLGVVGWWLGGHFILSTLFSGAGLVDFPLENDVLGMMIMAPAILVFCLLSAWIPAGRVLQINPRNLIVE